MHVRMTHVRPHSYLITELRSIYNTEIVPTVRQAKGNIDAFLLEPTNSDDPFISVTMWDNKRNADEYDASGLYQSLVDKVRHMFSALPVLKTYDTQH